jgi:hypothetical protein
MTNPQYIRFFLLFQFCLLLTFPACKEDAHLRPDNNNADNRQTKTQNGIVVIVDGSRELIKELFVRPGNEIGNKGNFSNNYNNRQPFSHNTSSIINKKTFRAFPTPYRIIRQSSNISYFSSLYLFSNIHEDKSWKQQRKNNC